YLTDAHKALNTLIQGSAARYTKRWMREVWRAGVVPMLQMHDSLDLSVSSPEQAEMVARLGEEVIKLEVPMVVDVKFGRTWADAEHTWSKLHAETDPHIEPAALLGGGDDGDHGNDGDGRGGDDDAGGDSADAGWLLWATTSVTEVPLGSPEFEAIL